MSEIEHGTVNAYDNLGCRCQDCRDAWAKYWREGPGYVTRQRYRQRLKEAGLVVSSSFTKPVRRVRP